MTRLLVTGGAGFVGANLAVELARRHSAWEVVAFDNLYRRGSELNLPRLAEAEVEFVRGDVRDVAQLSAVGDVTAIVECSAEPSVVAGFDGDLDYLVQTNLYGAYNCLQLARARGAQLVFLSTSRIYPTAALSAIALSEHESRFEIDPEQAMPGVTGAGISEEFPLEGARTPYGATKLGAELLIAEFVDIFGLNAVVDRCGVIAGPGQFGRVDQGIFSYWLLAHHFGRPLAYFGYGGKQVRDVLHIADLVDLIDVQLADPARWRGVTVNVGGGRNSSLSLREATDLCQELTGRSVEIRDDPERRSGDIPLYVSDCARVFEHTAWRPRRDPRAILSDTLTWIEDNETGLEAALGFGA